MRTPAKHPLAQCDGVLQTEMDVIQGLVRSIEAHAAIEIGMARGVSSVAILSALRSDGRLTSIDPFQLVPSGYGSAGVEAVRSAGFADRHTLLAEPDYVALPALLRGQRRFDFIFIDGYHSFDYTMLDFFYADLLLRVGGIVVFHDSNRSQVFRVCSFVAQDKPYRRLGPPLALRYRGLVKRAGRRVGYALSGRSREFGERRTRWKSLAAFVKEDDRMAPEEEGATRYVLAQRERG